MGWKPPSDPDLPPCPYVPGFSIKATEHEPPAPFGQGGYSFGTRPSLPRKWIGETPRTKQVLENPPQSTQWPSTTPPPTAVLNITEAIRTGQDRGAQLVVCQVHLDGQENPFTAVAKIYDPLYYSHCSVFSDSTPRDVVSAADYDYSREAVAYRHIEATKNLQKPGFAPEYYGSWTFELDLTRQGKVNKRSVRLILIEAIAGSSLLSLYTTKDRNAVPNAFQYNEAYRLDVIAEFLEGFVKQRHSGLDQRDLAPRNIMVSPSPQETMPPGSIPRVVLVDYNESVVYKYTKYARFLKQNSSLPINPAEMFWSDSTMRAEFYGWTPIEWYTPGQGNQSFQKWLLSRFGGDNMSRFAPITKELEFESYDVDWSLF
ncbi:hypothetical protein GGR51DRAFT_70679 [Nemania sp. FL0031]|nr:hypothetical protein GGR51DRAFT_70679 [Nemania sp. FL0031]